MKVGVIGLGSMGKRRIRLIKNNFPNIEIVGSDINPSRCREVSELFNIKTLETLTELLKDKEIDRVFICTPPLTHAKIIHEVLNADKHVFSEINLVNDLYDENIKLAKEKNLTLFLSSTQLYRKEINYISDKIDSRTNYIYHIGNYLPDWHPWENYNDFFVGNKRSNGCREIFAIELPWIVDCFGKITAISVSKSKITDLKIDYSDNFIVTVTHENNNKGVLITDLVSRFPVRNLEVLNEEQYYCWDGKPSGLKEWDEVTNKLKEVKLYKNIDKDNSYNETIIEDAYLEEIYDFFKAINAESEHGLYSFSKDAYIINIINKIEEVETYGFD